MTKEDVKKLFDLLEQLYQGKRRGRDDKTLSIWACVLAPWPYDQVRAAAIRRARENRYFPDPSELAELLPKAEPEGAETADREDTSWALPYLQKGLDAVSREQMEDYRAAGVRPWEEARAAGAGWPAWLQECRAAFSDGAGSHVIPLRAEVRPYG